MRFDCTFTGRSSALHLVLIALLLLLLASSPASAAQRWADLSAEQQAVLKPFESRWDRLRPRLQQRLLDKSAVWARYSPAQRSAMQQRVLKWMATPPEQRRRLRALHRRFKSLPAEQQNQLLQQFRNEHAIDPTAAPETTESPPQQGQTGYLLRIVQDLPRAERAEIMSLVRSLEAPMRKRLQLHLLEQDPAVVLETLRALVKMNARQRQQHIETLPHQ